MEVINRKLVRKYKAGYELWDEIVQVPDFHAEVLSDPNGDAQEVADEINVLVEMGRQMASTEGDVSKTMTMRAAYTPEGHYIGNPKDAYHLCKKRGIAPELKQPEANVCSIGFCEQEQKWYGWSHRAIFGFGVGDTVKKGDCTATSGWIDEYLAEHPEKDLSLPVGFQAKTLSDAKRMAIAFADSVS